MPARRTERDHARFDARARTIAHGGRGGVRFDLAGGTPHARAMTETLDAHDPNWRAKLAEHGVYALPSLIVEILVEDARVKPPRPRRVPASRARRARRAGGR